MKHKRLDPGHPFPVEALPPERRVVVPATCKSAGDSLYEVSQPGVARAGVTSTEESLQRSNLLTWGTRPGPTPGSHQAVQT